MSEGIIGVVITVTVAISVYIAGEVIGNRRQRIERRRVVLEAWLSAIADWAYEAKQISGVPSNTSLDRISKASLELSFHSSDRWVAEWLGLHIDALSRGARLRPQGTMDQLEFTVEYIGRWLIAWHKGTVRSSDFAPVVMLGTAGWGGQALGPEKYNQAVERGFQRFVEVFPMRVRDRLVLILLCAGENGEEMVRALSPREFAIWELALPRQYQLLSEGRVWRLILGRKHRPKSPIAEGAFTLWDHGRKNLIGLLHSNGDVWPPGSHDG